MSDVPSGPPAPPRKRSSLSIAIVVLCLLMMGAWWVNQRGSGPLEGWGQDIDQALEQGERLGKPVLAFFSSPG
ncbi:MAG: hypothetical protein JXB13_18330 [Phycisphaerae bacterium]|nr:hypothetical protein [Phycisphaerae bacterium]